MYLTYYKILNSKIIETEAGDFKIWIEKSKCYNKYIFISKQISVKYNGEIHYVCSTLPYIALPILEPINSVYSMDYMKYEPIKTVEIEMQNYKKLYIGKINRIKRELRMFEEWLKRNTKNIIK